MSKKNRFNTNNLSQMLVYVLGHRPFEFGIVPDAEGFVRYKDLLQVIHEEPGWGYVREGSINEVLMGEGRTFFDVVEGQIRAVERRWTLESQGVTGLPSKILFSGIRRKAHPVVIEKGLRDIGGPGYILTPDREMAERVGRRRDPQPVILEIMAEAAIREGLVFQRFGDLFLVNEVPARLIAGPPVPKRVIKAREAKEASKREQNEVQLFQPGTFILDMERSPNEHRREKGRKKRGWKEEARRERKRMRADPWG